MTARAVLEQANAGLARARDDAERRGAVTAAVLDTIDVAVVACDASGRVTLVNRAARAFHGVPEDGSTDPVAWVDRVVLHGEDGRTPLSREQTPLARALADGQVVDALVVLAPDGMPVRTVRCDGQAVRDAAGAARGAVVTMRDVTADLAAARELTAARDQALAATRAKTAFLAAASHEIRTPLNGVLGTLELLAAGTLSAQQAEHVQVARRSGEALLTLLNDVLDLSKAETTSVVLTSEPFSPCDVAADVLAALGPVARRKGLGVDLVTGRDELLLGDPRRLRQVLMNLVGNAVKFTDRGRIGIVVEVGPGPGAGVRALRLVVTDTGAGMHSDEVAQLFQPFVQGAQGERHGGTGLGLALSQQLVELMGGQVLVWTRLGHGTRFTVELDCPQADPLPQDPQPAGPAERSSPLRVLVADDGEVNLLVAKALLVLEGAEVVTAGDGDEAVDAVRAEPFDLVLLDRRMPRMSGLDAARAIRALPGRAGRTRLVALTASADEQDHRALVDAGMQDVLLKPVSREDLRAALADAVADRAPST